MVEGFINHRQNWTSVAVSLNDNREIELVYQVKRQIASGDGLPVRARGVQSLSVKADGVFGRPKEMYGDFYHCAFPENSLYRGFTTYRRLKSSQVPRIIAELERDIDRTE